MQVVQGYGNESNITEQIVELRNNIFPDNPVNNFEECCGTSIDKVYWIVLLWHNLPIAITALKWLDKGYWFMFNFGVIKLRRQQGFGKKLFEIVKNFIGEQLLMWLINKDNIGGQIFYRKMGCKDFGPIQDNLLMCYRN